MLVWAYLLPRDAPSHEERRKRKRCTAGNIGLLALLCTSEQIAAEVKDELYTSKVLTFVVSPLLNDSFQIRWAGSVHWSIFNVWDYHFQIFVDAAFQKFRRIQIELHAPCPEDPGQLVGCRKGVADLVAMLERANALPDIFITFLETASASWYSDCRLNKSVSCSGCPPIDISDVEHVLMPFLRVRRARNTVVSLPPKATADSPPEGLATAVQKGTILKTPFGDFIRKDGGKVDDEFRDWIDSATIWLDMELDDLPGRAAAILRRERFATWFEGISPCGQSMYATKMRTLLEPWHKAYENTSILPSEIDDQAYERLLTRYRAMNAFNPLSAARREALWLNYDSEDEEAKEADQYCSRPWRGNYPNGIPRSSSVEWLAEMNIWDDANRCIVEKESGEWLLD